MPCATDGLAKIGDAFGDSFIFQNEGGELLLDCFPECVDDCRVVESRKLWIDFSLVLCANCDTQSILVVDDVLFDETRKVS